MQFKVFAPRDFGILTWLGFWLHWHNIQYCTGMLGLLILLVGPMHKGLRPNVHALLSIVCSAECFRRVRTFVVNV